MAPRVKRHGHKSEVGIYAQTQEVAELCVHAYVVVVAGAGARLGICTFLAYLNLSTLGGTPAPPDMGKN